MQIMTFMGYFVILAMTSVALSGRPLCDNVAGGDPDCNGRSIDNLPCDEESGNANCPGTFEAKVSVKLRKNSMYYEANLDKSCEGCASERGDYDDGTDDCVKVY